VVFAGCAAKPKSQPVARKHDSGQSVARGDAKPQAAVGGGADAAAPDAPTITPGEAAPTSIAQHTEVYARNLESLLAKRAPKQKQDDAAAKSPEVTDDPAPEPTGGAANAAMKVSPPADRKKEPVNAEASVDESPAAAPPAAAAAKAETQSVAPSPAEAKPAAATARAAAPKPPTIPATADLLQQQVTTRAKQYPQDAAAQLDYQLLQFLRDESVPDLAAVAPLAAEDRELLTTLLDGLSNFRNGLRAEANMLESRKVAPLLEMADRLRAQAELSIPTALLCTKVERFGVYEPMQPAQFKAGAPNEAILYCEVANFSSQLGDGRQWETRLKHECVLYSETGLNVWHTTADPVTDQSRNRRHDFHVVRRLKVPAVPVGRYLLKVTVTDLQVNRVAEATVPIQVVAQ
jgi:hypothetical protein